MYDPVELINTVVCLCIRAKKSLRYYLYRAGFISKNRYKKEEREKRRVSGDPIITYWYRYD